MEIPAQTLLPLCTRCGQCSAMTGCLASLLHLMLVRTKNQPKDRSFRPDVPADIRPKTSVRPSKSWKKQAFRHGHAARTSTKKLRSEKLRADFSFPSWRMRQWGRVTLDRSAPKMAILRAMVKIEQANPMSPPNSQVKKLEKVIVCIPSFCA